MDEVYKELAETGYKVSNCGNVVSPSGRVLTRPRTNPKPRRNKDLCASLLVADGKWRSFRIARLVLHLFGDVPLTKRVTVAYRDNNPDNLHLDNLDTVRVHTSKPPKAVYEFDLSGKPLASYDSVYRCAKEVGAEIMAISTACRKGTLCRNRLYQFTPEFNPALLTQLQGKGKAVRSALDELGKTIHQYALSGDHLRSFGSIMTVQAVLGITDPSHIYKVIRGERANAFGFIWAEERRDNIIRHKRMKFRYVLQDLDGTVLATADKLSEAEVLFKMNRSVIYEFLNGTRTKYYRNVKVVKEHFHKFDEVGMFMSDEPE